MTAPTGFSVNLPAWVDDFVHGWKGRFDSVERCMELAVALSGENIARDSGGPFGAVVACPDDGQLLGVGVNTVTDSGLSIAHAEMVALSIAQVAIGTWNLRKSGAVVLLATSCEPCAMCYGAVPWSGISMLAWGARREDAEACGFDEGEKPSDWQNALNRRGIDTLADVLRDDAASVLAKYARRSGVIYHPSKTEEDP